MINMYIIPKLLFYKYLYTLMFNFLSSDLSLVEDDLLWEYGNAQITAAAQLTGTAQNTNRIGSKRNTSIHD